MNNLIIIPLFLLLFMPRYKIGTEKMIQVFRLNQRVYSQTACKTTKKNGQTFPCVHFISILLKFNVLKKLFRINTTQLQLP
jgi:hypothetical protein